MKVELTKGDTGARMLGVPGEETIASQPSFFSPNIREEKGLI